MNKLVIAGLAAALAGATVAPPAAEAGDEVAAAIGGFIGGVIVGSVVGDRHDRPAARYDRDCHPPRGGRVIIDVGRRHSGHWEWVEVRAWVPGHFIFNCDRSGRRYRTWFPGRYEIRRERVWVERDRRGERRRDGYAYHRH